MCYRALNPVLCDNLEMWDGVGGGRQFQEGGDLYVHIYIHTYIHTYMHIYG